MEGKLRLITRSPRSILAYKGAAFSVLLGMFMAYPGWKSAVLYCAGACILYARPLFNTSAFAPLFAALLIASFSFPSFTSPFRIGLVIVFSVLFAIIIGVKNLVLTHREQWVRGVAYALSYCTLIIFFLASPENVFWLSWVGALFTLSLIWSVVVPDYRIMAPMILVLGELMWVASWLPIGFFASANMLFLTMLFIGEAFFKRRIFWNEAAVFALLIIIVLGTSYWRL